MRFFLAQTKMEAPARYMMTWYPENAGTRDAFAGCLRGGLSPLSLGPSPYPSRIIDVDFAPDNLGSASTHALLLRTQLLWLCSLTK